jgi:hypothetical protein
MPGENAGGGFREFLQLHRLFSISRQDFALAYCAPDKEICFLLMSLNIYDNEL